MLKNKYYFVSESFAVLTFFFFLATNVGYSWIYIRMFNQDGMSTTIWSLEWWVCLAIITIFFFGLVVVMVVKSFDYFGWWRINGNVIRVYSPFRPPISLQCDNINFVGIDYDIHNHSRQYWIVLGEKAPEIRFQSKIVEMPITKHCVRFQFSQSKYDALIRWLPPLKAKELYRAKSILRNN